MSHLSVAREESFNPIRFGFEWTDPEPGEQFGWYEFDHPTAYAAAVRARDERAKELKAEGFTVRRKTRRRNLMSMGGIGTNRPHIELLVDIPVVIYY